MFNLCSILSLIILAILKSEVDFPLNLELRLFYSTGFELRKFKYSKNRFFFDFYSVFS